LPEIEVSGVDADENLENNSENPTDECDWRPALLGILLNN
jgi:hypothetical protein